MKSKPVLGYEHRYLVTNTGKVFSLNYHKTGKKKQLRQTKDKDGYYCVALCINGTPKTIKVHRLVCAAFHKNPEKKKTVNHKNGIKSDNRSVNLEWSTHREQNLHSFRVLGRVQVKNMLGRLGALNHRSKPIIQLSLDGISLFRFDGIAEANRKTGINSSSIVRSAKLQQKSAGGFIWRYA